jgi:hypothetical protein
MKEETPTPDGSPGNDDAGPARSEKPDDQRAARESTELLETSMIERAAN